MQSKVINQIDGVCYEESDGVALLIEAAARVCGSRDALARRLGVTRSAVQQWANGSLELSANRINQLRDIIGGADEKR